MVREYNDGERSNNSLNEKETGKMNMIMAVIKHYKLDDVRKALTDLNVLGITITEVKGFGKQKGHTEVYRGMEYEVRFLPKIKVEVVVSEDDTQKAINAIETAARTGEIGDGKIFIYPLTDVIRIRTGEHGKEAI